MIRVAGLTLTLAVFASIATAQVTVLPDPPVAGSNLTISYDPTGGPLDASTQGFLRYGFNGWHPTIDPDPEMTTNGVLYEVTIPVPTQATEINFVFRDGADPQNFDNNNNQNWNMVVTNGVPNPDVTTLPSPIAAGQNVVITYDATNGPFGFFAEEVNLNYGFNGWSYVAETPIAMTETTPGSGIWEGTVPVKSYATEMNFYFDDGDLTVDNNDGFDWNFEVTGGTPRCSVNPDPPVALQNVTVTYNPEDGVLDGVSPVYAHLGFDGWNYTEDLLMTSNGALWEVTVAIPLHVCVLDVVFTDLGSIWDNNDGNDWHFDIDGCTPLTNELDGLFVAKYLDPWDDPAFDMLHIGIAGNLERSGSAFVIFINEPNATGQTELQVGGAGGTDPMLNASRRMDIKACDTVGSGTMLPGEADFALYINRQGDQVYVDEYKLRMTAQDTLTCCDGSTLDVLATQRYDGYTIVNDGNEAFEGDEGWGFWGGFDDTNIETNPALVDTGLEIAIPMSLIGNGLGRTEDVEIFVAMMPNMNGTDGQFSNQTLPSSNDLAGYCSPPQMFPLRADISSYSTVFSANVASLPTFGGVADGQIVAADYNGSADAIQACDAAEAVVDATMTIVPGAVQGEDITVWYVSTNGPLDGAAAIDLKYGFDGDLSTPLTIAMVATTGYTGSEWKATLTMPVGALQFDAYVTDGVVVDDNTGQNWHFEVNAPASGETVSIDPDPAQAGSNVTIYYDPTGRVLEGGSQINIHYGFNGWNDVTDAPMTMGANCIWEVTILVPPYASGAQGLNVVFNADGISEWDNNDGNNWNFQVDNAAGDPPWVTSNGYLDGCATLVASSTNGLRNLYAGYQDGYLYVATEHAVNGSHDAFILITPGIGGTPFAAPWAKAGLVATAADLEEPFLAQEEGNGWTGWFVLDPTTNRSHSVQNTDRPYLEGQFDLVNELGGSVPATIYLSAVGYTTGDGGALLADQQTPEGNGDGNVDGSEYVAVDLSSILVSGTFDVADIDEDCDVDIDDFNLFADCMLGPDVTPTCTEDADLDGDGDVDLMDFVIFQQHFGN